MGNPAEHSLGESMWFFVVAFNYHFTDLQFAAATIPPSIDGSELNASFLSQMLYGCPLNLFPQSGPGGLDDAIQYVSNARAQLGAISNRLDFTRRSLDISSENLQDAESRIRNTDMAREMMRFTMSNVLQQAAVSMLSQANQLPNALLQLLR